MSESGCLPICLCLPLVYPHLSPLHFPTPLAQWLPPADTGSGRSWANDVVSYHATCSIFHRGGSAGGGGGEGETGGQGGGEGERGVDDGLQVTDMVSEVMSSRELLATRASHRGGAEALSWRVGLANADLREFVR